MQNEKGHWTRYRFIVINRNLNLQTHIRNLKRDLQHMISQEASTSCSGLQRQRQRLRIMYLSTSD